MGAESWGLRDASLETWSRPSKSKALDKEFKKRTSHLESVQPKLHSKEAVALHAATLEEEKKLMMICQKTERTEEEVRFTQSYMCQFPFFRLWPEAVQRELARVLLTEVRVCHETIITRGTSLTKVFFLLRGLLHVTVPETLDPGAASSAAESLQLVHASGNPDPAASAPTPAPGRITSTTRVLATLRKGDTCGEAVLLGNSTAHADVVVTSPGAVMLSLCHADFLRSLKEILGLRQQDRLMYLRMHPLFVEVSLEDLDRASDLLNMAFYPPGSHMHPQPRSAPEAQRVFFIAEGECSVKRRGGGGGHSGDAERAQPAYDADTVSVLGPLDVFGLEAAPAASPSHHSGSSGHQGHHAHGHHGGHHGHRQRGAEAWVVESLTQVKAYYMTLEQFFSLPQSMQKVVRDASEFKARYLRGRAQVLSRLDEARKDPTYAASTYYLGDAKMSTVGPLEAAKAGAGGNAGGSGRGGRSSKAPGASKVAGTLDKLAARQVRELLEVDAAKETAASMGLTMPAAQELLTTGALPGALSSGSPTASASHTSPAGRSRPRPDSSGPTGASAGPRMAYPYPISLYPENRQQQQQQAAGAGPSGAPGGVSAPGGQQQPQPQFGARRHGSPVPAPPLGVLPPDTTTWSRLEFAKHRTVESEAPRPQPVPMSLRQRHTAVFRAAQYVAHRPPGIAGDRSESDDEKIDNGLYVTKQASRRLSARLRHSDERGTTGTWYGERSRQGSAQAGHAAIPRISPISHADLPAAGGRDGWGGGAGGGSGMPAHAVDRDLLAALQGQQQQLQQEEWEREVAAASGGVSGGGGGGALNQTKRRGPGGAAAAADGGWQGQQGGSEQQQQQQQQQQVPLPEFGGEAGGAGASGQQGGGSVPGQQRLQVLVPERPVHHLPVEPDVHEVQDLQDTVHEKGRIIRTRPGKAGGAPQQQQHAQQQHHHGGGGSQQQQRHHYADGGAQDQSGGGNVVGLPASVVLGYENLDPFQWAALMSHVAPGSRGQGSQENVLPRPKW